MANKPQLTNEELSDVFTNKFDLALHIIKIAQNQMKAGNEVTLSKLLLEIRKEAQAKIDAENDEEQLEEKAE